MTLAYYNALIRKLTFQRTLRDVDGYYNHHVCMYLSNMIADW